MHKGTVIAYLMLFVTVPLCFYCSAPEQITGGNSSETVIGKICNTDGSPASSTVVTLYPDDYNPVLNREEYVAGSDTTDEDGCYFLNVPDSLSECAIMATSLTNGNRAFITDVRTFEDSTVVHDAVLSSTGVITIPRPQRNDVTGAYVYIPGTNLAASFDNTDPEVTLDSVPSGIIPRVVFSSPDNSEPSGIRYSVAVTPGDTTTVTNVEWPYTCRLYLNTGANGALVQGDVYHFPVCVRLTEDNFDFSQADADGVDIRFAEPSGRFIPFEIEHWNSGTRQAVVWVMVDTVYGNNDSQFICMYWGNTASENESDGKMVFDTAAGFQGVWHLAENGNSTLHDATHNHYDGTPYNMNDSPSTTGVAGTAVDFDGIDDYIVAHGTADGKLDFPENGRYSVSLWAYADSVDSLWHGIAGKGHRQYYLQYKCFHDTAASWEFVEFQEGWNYSEYQGHDTLQDNEWVYLTGVRDGARQYLYVNGEPVTDTALLNADQTERDTDGDFTIGCHLQYEMFPDMVPMNLTFFNGKIDEVRVMSRPTDPDWIKLCYMNQKKEDTLVEFR